MNTENTRNGEPVMSGRSDRGGELTGGSLITFKTRDVEPGQQVRTTPDRSTRSHPVGMTGGDDRVTRPEGSGVVIRGPKHWFTWRLADVFTEPMLSSGGLGRRRSRGSTSTSAPSGDAVRPWCAARCRDSQAHGCCARHETVAPRLRSTSRSTSTQSTLTSPTTALARVEASASTPAALPGTGERSTDPERSDRCRKTECRKSRANRATSHDRGPA
jgi:hypothetical protein